MRLRTTSKLIAGLLALGVAISAGAAKADDPDPAPDLVAGWCGTQIHYQQSLAESERKSAFPTSACPDEGLCDDPALRDTFIPDGSSPFITIRLAIHIIANDGGSGPFTTPELVEDAIDLVNAHYAPGRIRFEYLLDQVNSTEWRALILDEVDPMKEATAVDPAQRLNVWLTAVLFGYSFGTYPFEADALGPTGGIILGQNQWGSNHTGLAHEIGHCLGLWHPFYGVAEVEPCGVCYEAVDTPDLNVVGDRCADTPPAPAWYQCSDADGVDECSGLAWGATQPENIMGYAPNECRTLFTPQQRGRMRCWIDDVLSGWVAGYVACCEGRVGDANGLGGDEPTIGDVSVLIDALFINSTCIDIVACVGEADVNQSGGTEPECEDVTIGDISVLVDYLFITGQTLGLNDCF